MFILLFLSVFSNSKPTISFHVYQIVTWMNCTYCNGCCIRKGIRKTVQKYQCKSCKKYQQAVYSYRSCTTSDKQIVQLIIEGCGILGSARILGMSPTTIISRILKMARVLRRGTVRVGRTYQIDELFTYIGNKRNRVCIAYSIDAETGEVIDIIVRRRNKTNLQKVVSTLVLSGARRITTDKLTIYKELIPQAIHSTKFRGINKIERSNLNLRTHLKRLNRRTICYSKSLAVLTAVVKIYFWE